MLFADEIVFLVPEVLGVILKNVCHLVAIYLRLINIDTVAEVFSFPIEIDRYTTFLLKTEFFSIPFLLQL